MAVVKVWGRMAGLYTRTGGRSETDTHTNEGRKLRLPRCVIQIACSLQGHVTAVSSRRQMETLPSAGRRMGDGAGSGGEARGAWWVMGEG